MSRRLSIDEEVAGGLLRLLGYASYSMARAQESEDDERGESVSPAPIEAEVAPVEPGHSGEAASPPSATEHLFSLLKLASRGESPVPRSGPQLELSTREAESGPVSVRPRRERPIPLPEVPTVRMWRRAMTLSPREAPDETQQITLWLESLDSTVADPSNDEES